jgi:hypothetical protein
MIASWQWINLLQGRCRNTIIAYDTRRSRGSSLVALECREVPIMVDHVVWQDTGLARRK